MKEKLSYGKTKKFILPYIEESYDTYKDQFFKKKLYSFGIFKNYLPERRETVEVLAPASAQTYKQAVHGGADAIYFGYGEYNARANGDNFFSIKEVVDYCHFYNVKAYLALNISIKNSELNNVTKIIDEAESANIDAFIICDFALIPLIRQHSKAAIHASTQMGVHNTWGRDFLFDFTMDRAVLSREMTVNDLAEVVDRESIETEIFVHGALCSCFSGACLFSSMLTGNSANRGKCNQLCRMFFKAYVDGNLTTKGYLLSAKDICLSEYVETVADLGVNSLKIEGRLKRAEYVAGVTMYYAEKKLRRDAILTKDELKILFNRGNFTPGYFEGNNVIYPARPNHIGIYAGKIVCVIGTNKAYVKTEIELSKKNGYKVLRNTEEIGGAIFSEKVSGGLCLIESNVPLKQGDILRLTNDTNLTSFLINRKKIKNVPIAIRIAAGEKPRIVLNIKGNRVIYNGNEVVQAAKKYPLTHKEIFDLFDKSKVREIKFLVTEIELFNAFMTKAELNTLRRETLDYIWKFLLGYYYRKPLLFNNTPAPKYPSIARIKTDSDFCEIDSFEKYVLVRNHIKNIVYNPTVYTKEKCREFYDAVKNDDNLIFLKLPIYISPSKEFFFERIIKKFDGVLTNNIGGIFVAAKLNKLVVLGQNINITNNQNWLVENCCDFIVSTELGYNDIKKFGNPLVYTYGYLPLMHLNFCPRKLAGMTCEDCEHKLQFKDEKGEYLITTQKFDGYCEHLLHNSRLTDIGTQYSVRHYFDFTLSEFSEIKQVLALYKSNNHNPINTNKLRLTRGI